jgi:P27 family predicted phage terminase small subunit
MRGRKPKSDEEKALTGNPGKRKLNKNRPQAPDGPMKCPAYFNREQRTIWEETLANAIKGTMKPSCIEVLITYCVQVSIQRQAMRELAQMMKDNSAHVMTVETERGWVKNPLITVIDTCAKNIRSYASELCLTVASQQRLASKLDEGEEDPWANFDTPADAAKVN